MTLNTVFIALICLLTSCCIFLFVRNVFLSRERNELNLKVMAFPDEKISYLNKIQELETTLYLKQEQDKHNRSYHTDFENMAQQTLIQISSSLTKQLVESYTQHSKVSQQQSEKQMKDATCAINEKIEQLSHSSKLLEKEMEKSSNAVFDLKRSLLSSASIGSFTELTLQNILSASGLQKNVDFFLQPTLHKDLKSYRPDVVVKLPGNNFIIVDAKATKFFLESELSKDNCDSKKDLAGASNNFIKMMYAHIKNLSSKEYFSCLQSSIYDRLNVRNIKHSNITTVMFLHSEAVIEKINTLDSNFLYKAWQLNIFPVGPTGIMNILSIARQQINQKKQFSNYDKILIEIKNMLDSLSVLVDHANKLGTSIQTLTTCYDKFAASFNHNFLSKSNKVAHLGVSPSRVRENKFINRYDLCVSKTNIINVPDVSSDDVHSNSEANQYTHSSL